MKLRKKQWKKIFLMLLLLFLCSGCTPETASAENADKGKTETEETDAEDYYHDYKKTGGQVALVIDKSSVMDNGYNQAAYEGAKSYAQSAGVSYSCYGASSDSAQAYKKAVLTAVENDARLVICAGSCFEEAVGSLQDSYADISFLLLDGVPRDDSGQALAIAPNVHCITYHEEQAGYLAGYMTVLEGYKNLGFIGGEPLPSVERYGYGYLQGIDDAAARLGNSGDIRVDYWYAETFLPDGQIERMSADWYEAGTEVIFACGGSLYQSVLDSAQACGGRLIGADTDQSGISELFLTSAMKGVKSSIVIALDDFYANGKKWPQELAGRAVSYGAAKKCIKLPYSGDAWRFENVTTDEYLQVLADLKAGKIQVSDEIGSRPKTAVSVIYHND